MKETVEQDFLDHIKDREVKCVTLSLINRSDYSFNPLADLKIGYSPDDYKKFLALIDVEFYSGYGTQEVDGVIWYKDGTWSSRGEYDGSEWWEYNTCPEIPETLNK